MRGWEHIFSCTHVRATYINTDSGFTNTDFLSQSVQLL